jgi:hypothetical protein
MNTETGRYYDCEKDIVAAITRKEPLEFLDADAKDWQIKEMQTRANLIAATRQVLSVSKRKKLKL